MAKEMPEIQNIQVSNAVQMSSFRSIIQPYDPKSSGADIKQSRKFSNDEDTADLEVMARAPTAPQKSKSKGAITKKKF